MNTPDELSPPLCWQDVPPQRPWQLTTKALLPLKGDQGSAALAAAPAAAAASSLPAARL